MKDSFKIIYQDTDIMVIDKPAGLVVESGNKARIDADLDADDIQIEKTLEEILMNDYKIDLPRGGVVHRLDRDTSGLMVIAKNEKALVDLQNQFASHQVKKIYYALVYGKIEPRKGTINIALKRDLKNRTRFIAARGKDAKEAITHYEVLENHNVETNGRSSLLKINIETGRTHQIRAHFFAIGFPIIGDQVYKTRDSERLSDELGLNRQFLHAGELSFTHPGTKKVIDFQSQLPDNLNKYIKEINS